LFIFDILFIWGIYLPTAYLLVSKTAWSILIVYLTVQVLEMLKSAFLTFLLKKGYWVKNLAQKDMKIL
jgi:Na+-driven multidrug efflux pump